MGKIKNEFGEHLKKLVGDAGLTVEAFARALKCHVDAPQKWFSGKSYPHRKYHKRMTEILRVSENVLLMKEPDGVGSLESKLPALAGAATMKEIAAVDPLLTQTLLSINLRLSNIEIKVDDISREVKTHQHPLSYGASPSRKKSA